MKLIDKAAIVAEIDKRMQELHPTNTHKMQTGEKVDRDVLMWLNALTWVKDVLNSIETKAMEDKEIPTSGECVTLSKERYQELLEYESVALWAFNVIIVASLPSIEDEKLKEISDDVKCKAIQAAFQEALKNKEDKE